jgi:hypothetical protein
MGERWAEAREARDEWIAVLRPAYADARHRHAKARAEAYDLAGFLAVQRGLCGPDLRFSDIDEEALAAWQRAWRSTHPSGAGGWNWRTLVEGLPRRAAVLPVAIWYGTDLCGLALGQLSRRRFNGSRHTVTLTYVERRPEPPGVPLRGQVVAIATTVAESYGVIMGARRLRLRAPDRNLLWYYEKYGFEVVRRGTSPLYCEREIRP